ncbi:putative n2,n2-dimethylguanosine trna methyltransferase, partial [Globisporangium splendens]
MGSVDFVLTSDVVWVEELIPPLVQTFDVLLRSSQVPTTVLMSYQKRSIVSDQLLFSELEKHNLAKRKIPSSALHPEFTSERIDVWEITRASGAAKEELQQSPSLLFNEEYTRTLRAVHNACD